MVSYGNDFRRIGACDPAPSGGRLHEAEQIYRQVLAVEPNQVEALILLGEIVEQQGNLDAAIACWRRVVELEAGLRAVRITTWAWPARHKAIWTRPSPATGGRLELSPDYAEAHNNLGVAFKERGNLDAAIACCRRAWS